MVERHNPYAPPIATGSPAKPDSPATSEPNGPRGIGGWLVVMLLGLVIWTIAYGVGLYNLVLHIDQWAESIQRRDPFTLARILLLTILFVVGLVAIVWMVQHDRRFPKLAMAYYVLQLAFFAVVVAATADPSEASKQYDVMLIMLVRTLVWFNFFRVSDRAANTFVR